MTANNPNLHSKITIWLKNYWPWLIVVALLFYPIWYTIDNWDEDGYQDGMIGNLVATLIGVAIGVPVALEFERWRQAREDVKGQDEAKRKAKQVAQLLKEELSINLRQLKKMTAKNDKFYVLPIRDVTWRAISDSGEIRWLDNLEILAALSRTYYDLSIVSKLNGDGYDAASGLNPMHVPGSRKVSEMGRSLQESSQFTQTRVTQMIDLLTQAFNLSDTENTQDLDSFNPPNV